LRNGLKFDIIIKRKAFPCQGKVSAKLTDEVVILKFCNLIHRKRSPFS
jgi:hypothetical protein